MFKLSKTNKEIQKLYIFNRSKSNGARYSKGKKYCVVVNVKCRNYKSTNLYWPRRICLLLVIAKRSEQQINYININRKYIPSPRKPTEINLFQTFMCICLCLFVNKSPEMFLRLTLDVWQKIQTFRLNRIKVICLRFGFLLLCSNTSIVCVLIYSEAEYFVLIIYNRQFDVSQSFEIEADWSLLMWM